MVLITGTNIVVDEFDYGKRTPWIRYIYFLTHYHADHYQGLTSAFSYGKVYCSNETKPLILNKFKNIQDIEGLEIDKPHTIYLNAEKTKSVQVTMLDANHVAGSVIILFQGYMGTILHTGDFRFHSSMFYKHTALYPPEKRTKDFAKCSIHIDELIYDNTFCDPVFTFPPRVYLNSHLWLTLLKEKAVADTIKIIEKHKGKRFQLGIYTWGKEEMLVLLAEYFKTKIVVDEARLKNLKAINFKPELFTTNKSEGYIYAAKTLNLSDEENRNLIYVRLTGWVNIETFSSADQKSYYVPYSSHSNYKEIEMFVKSIHPCVLKTVVRHENTAEKLYRMSSFSSYMMGLSKVKHRGHEIFLKNYTTIQNLSPEYRKWQNTLAKAQLDKELELKKLPQQIKAYITELQEKNPRLHSHFIRRKERFAERKKKVEINNSKDRRRSRVEVVGIKDPKLMHAKSATLDSIFSAKKDKPEALTARSMSLNQEPSVLSRSSSSPCQTVAEDAEDYEDIGDVTQQMLMYEEDAQVSLSHLEHSPLLEDAASKDMQAEFLSEADQSLFPPLIDNSLRKKVFTQYDAIHVDKPAYDHNS